MGRFSCDEFAIREGRGCLFRPKRITKSSIRSIAVGSRGRVTFDETVLVISDGFQRMQIGELEPDFEQVASFVDALGAAPRWRDIFVTMHPDLEPIEIFSRRPGA